MSSMFYGCSGLIELDLASFDTSSVTDMYGMFQSCTSLTELNLSSFDFTNVVSYGQMFLNVPTDCLIYVKDETAKAWIEEKFTDLTNVQIKN